MNTCRSGLEYPLEPFSDFKKATWSKEKYENSTPRSRSNKVISAAKVSTPTRYSLSGNLSDSQNKSDDHQSDKGDKDTSNYHHDSDSESFNTTRASKERKTIHDEERQVFSETS